MRPIDADALILQAHEKMYAYEAEQFKAWISRFPTIDPESLRPQGEWIDKGEVVPLEVHRYQCSNCKKDELMFPHRKSNYCPNCGAKMKGADVHDLV